MKKNLWLLALGFVPMAVGDLLALLWSRFAVDRVPLALPLLMWLAPLALLWLWFGVGRRCQRERAPLWGALLLTLSPGAIGALLLVAGVLPPPLVNLCYGHILALSRPVGLISGPLWAVLPTGAAVWAQYLLPTVLLGAAMAVGYGGKPRGETWRG